MSDEVQVTSTSWFSRLGSAIKGVFIGMLLVLASIILLWWNEGRSVRRYKEISFAKENTVETPYDSIDASKEGKLVHFAGKASTSDVLTDPTFGVQVKDSYKLVGNVEVYQWIEKVIPGKTETKKKLGGGEEKIKHPDKYEYYTDWSSTIVNSDSFHEKDANRKNIVTTMPYETVKNPVKASLVMIGAHKLESSYIDSLGNSTQTVLIEEEIKDKIPATAIIDKNYIYYNAKSEDDYQKLLAGNAAVTPAATTTTTEETVATETAAATETTAAVAQNTANPAAYRATPGSAKVGDVRISFTHKPVGDVTVIAQQVGDSFQRYIIDKDDGLDYIDVRDGILEAKEVFAKNESAESMMVWGLRFLGFIIMASAFGMIFKPISVLADVVPLFGDIAESGIGIISGLIAFVLSMFIIALAWLWYRPLLGILLLVLMGAAIFGIITLIAKARAAKKAKAAPAAEPAPEATPAA